MMPFEPPVAVAPAPHPLRLGAFVGAGFAAVALAWLLVANRLPALELFAPERNLIAAVAAGLLLLMPIGWFAKSPGRMFVSGGLASLIAALLYRIAEIFFPQLAGRMGAFHVFMLGALAYGFVAVLDWVVVMFVVARRQPLAAERRRLP
jgi:hypothetical protein